MKNNPKKGCKISTLLSAFMLYNYLTDCFTLLLRDENAMKEHKKVAQ